MDERPNGKEYPVTVHARGRLIPRIRMRIPYDKIEEGLKGGYDVFVEGIKRQTAYSATARLSADLGMEVVAFPTTDDGKRGYLFTTREALVQWAKKHGMNVG